MVILKLPFIHRNIMNIGVGLQLYNMIKEQSSTLLYKLDNSQEILKLIETQFNKEKSQKLLIFQQKQAENISHPQQYQAVQKFERPYKKCSQWSKSQDDKLIQLHNQKGNKWVQIGFELKRSDNQVKNYYHSKLRKTFRKINRYVISDLKTKKKPLKMNILSKIMQTAQLNYHNREKESQYARGLAAFNLKNKIIQLGQLQSDKNQNWSQDMKNLIDEIEDFNKQNQKEFKYIKVNDSNKYKAKQIKKLILENKKHEQESKSIKVNQSFANSKNVKIQHKQTLAELNESVPLIPNDKNFNISIAHPYMNSANIQTYYLYNPIIAYQPMHFKLYNQQTPLIYSQKNSAFSFVGSSLNYKDLNNNPINLNYLNGNLMSIYMPHEFSHNI